MIGDGLGAGRAGSEAARETWAQAAEEGVSGRPSRVGARDERCTTGSDGGAAERHVAGAAPDTRGMSP